MKHYSQKKWNLTIDAGYLPSVSILIPVYNEQQIIDLKLENLTKVVYPSDKMEIIVVNDASSDNTLKIVDQYIAEHQSQVRIRVFDSKEHLGKTGCLNQVLKTVQSEIVIISDADCFWPKDILQKSLSYLSDPSVGAITAREQLLNSGDTWVTRGEQVYNNTIQAIRIGESKLYATLFFQGGFAAYKRSLLSEFNHAADDSGTALDVIQANKRALLIPEISFFTISPTVWQDKFTVKIRRASHLQQLWIRCLNLLMQGKLLMPKRIAIPEIILHIFNPLLLIVLVILTVAVMVSYPFLALGILIAVGLVFGVKKTQTTAIELIQNNLILLIALTSFLTKHKFRFWKPVEGTRSALNKQMLQEKQLL
ncbi:MAG: glycosyltransferase [Nitrososphaerota archaeon]|nr:glycosyltransferase [Nitrososphaerota archaeon]